MAAGDVPPGKKLVCVKWITKKGKRIYASSYGLQAFCFLVDA